MSPIHCPICADKAIPDTRAHKELSLQDAPTTYTILRCTGCGLRWLTPYAEPDDIQAIYDRDYYGLQPGSDFSYADEKRQLAPCYTEIAQRFLSFGITDGVLDIGCGTGDFLIAARQGGIQGEGIEPSAYAANQACRRGLLVTHGLLSDVLKKSKRYAAAHCSHVLEHVPDAHSFMEHMNEALEPGAPVYIEVPIQFDGILDWLNRLRGQQRRYSNFSIHHHYFFTATAVTYLLKKHGFNIISLTTYLPCRRKQRKRGFRKWGLQSLLWIADELDKRGDVISVWARRAK